MASPRWREMFTPIPRFTPLEPMPPRPAVVSWRPPRIVPDAGAYICGYCPSPPISTAANPCAPFGPELCRADRLAPRVQEESKQVPVVRSLRMSRPAAAVHRVIKAYDVRGLVGDEINDSFVGR